MAIRMPGYAGRGKDDPGRRSGLHKWAYGKKITIKGRGKDSDYTTYEGSPSSGMNYTPKTARKTGAGIFKATKIDGKKYVAGGNVLDREGDVVRQLTFEESLAQGTRADDPRNWEYYYNESKVGPGWGKDLDPREKKAQARIRARRRAQREAKLAGQEVYDTLKAEYETAAIREQAMIAKLKAKASGVGRFGSTKVAQDVAAAKMSARRATSRGEAGTMAGEAMPTAGTRIPPGGGVAPTAEQRRAGRQRKDPSRIKKVFGG